MKPASAKAKGRRLQSWVARHISRVTRIPWGKDCMIEPREMGQCGVDIKLYAEAAEAYPFSVECKNTERLNLKAAIEQAKQNCKPGTDWQLFHKRNNQAPVVIMDAGAFFDLYEQYLDTNWR
jgi:hypothetical protein